MRWSFQQLLGMVLATTWRVEFRETKRTKFNGILIAQEQVDMALEKLPTITMHPLALLSTFPSSPRTCLSARCSLPVHLHFQHFPRLRWLVFCADGTVSWMVTRGGPMFFFYFFFWRLQCGYELPPAVFKRVETTLRTTSHTTAWLRPTRSKVACERAHRKT